MADLIFVNTEQFKKLREENIGIYVVDNIGVPMILLDYFVIKILDTIT